MKVTHATDQNGNTNTYLNGKLAEQHEGPNDEKIHKIERIRVCRDMDDLWPIDMVDLEVIQ